VHPESDGDGGTLPAGVIKAGRGGLMAIHVLLTFVVNLASFLK